eukprot:GFYU01017413.1.p1 GENE.GFYU01017413.1~~GFYU01017413.1.p1  ORF type:complete len:230 (+),score=39.35 GFYU01017413.1:25-690(+)
MAPKKKPNTTKTSKRVPTKKHNVDKARRQRVPKGTAPSEPNNKDDAHVSSPPPSPPPPAFAGREPGQELSGMSFVKVGNPVHSSFATFVKAHGGVFDKNQQCLRRSVTHLLDGGGKGVGHPHRWTSAVVQATERGLPIVVLPDQVRGSDVTIEKVMGWVDRATAVTNQVYVPGTTRQEYANAYYRAFPEVITEVPEQRDRWARVRLAEGGQRVISLKWKWF